MINEPKYEPSFTKETMVTKKCPKDCHAVFSWGAVFLGGFVGFGLSFLLNLFCLAIGLTLFTFNENGLLSLAVGGLLGMLVGGIVTMFITGWTAGFFARTFCFDANYGVLYGFIAWCFALIISAFFAMHISHLISSQPYLADQNSAVTSDIHTKTMQTISQKIDVNPRVSTNTAKTNPEIAAHNMGVSMFIAFILYFIGGLASCLGGYFGMKARIRKGFPVHSGYEGMRR